MTLGYANVAGRVTFNEITGANPVADSGIPD
jgi:hypothetical protein